MNGVCLMKKRVVVSGIAVLCLMLSVLSVSCHAGGAFSTDIYFYVEGDSEQKNMLFEDTFYDDALMPYDSAIGVVSVSNGEPSDVDAVDSEVVSNSEWSSFFSTFAADSGKPVLYKVSYTLGSTDEPFSNTLTFSYKDSGGVKHQFTATVEIKEVKTRSYHVIQYTAQDSNGKVMHILFTG